MKTPKALPTNEVRRPAKLAHVVLRSRHYRESVDFYARVLGAKVVFGNDFVSFLTYDDEHHRVAVANVPGAPEAPKGAAGMDHVAFTYAHLGDLLQTYKRLREEGTRPVWCINHGPTTSLYYADPDGNRVELQIDNFANTEELLSWMRSGAFTRNPIGVEFDPERLLSRYERGDPVEELVRQGSA